MEVALTSCKDGLLKIPETQKIGYPRQLEMKCLVIELSSYFPSIKFVRSYDTGIQSRFQAW